MKTTARLQQWRDSDAITTEQFASIDAIVRKERFSVFLELNALLYLGVLFCIAGIGWVIQEYFASVGDVAIISGLTLILAASFYYCFSRGLPYSSGEVESPNLAFDYILYLGCLTFALELTYVETRFHFMENNWDVYLLSSSLLFFILAYRFDNRFVLSLALSTLAGWFGIRVSRFYDLPSEALRPYVLIYGVIVATAGAMLRNAGIKKHFLETYLHVAAVALFGSLLSGVVDRDGSGMYLIGLVGLAGLAIYEGLRHRRIAFVAYGVIAGYIGISARLLQDFSMGETLALTYIVISGSLVIVSMIILARRFGREE